ncbi:MAG: universal stress protein [Mitsuaria chitosanitabida]|uniref:universal stress protein n=1 Tax=Roseateles chitosanitabidus TaxID=65048 RepID=UPI001B0C99FC|nr:universal stress protein [Roseateles chitosanitabidus]MBO9689975.1 universal stress protein [Roseateles chitosanitabidus]
MYAKILVPVDGSPTSNAGLAEAIRLAKLSGGEIRLLHALDLQAFSMMSSAGLGITPDNFEQIRAGGKKVLDDAAATVRAAGIAVSTQLSESLASRVSDLVTGECASWGGAVIVLGTHGRRGLSRALLGSDAELIVRYAEVPVLLVRGPQGG